MKRAKQVLALLLSLALLLGLCGLAEEPVEAAEVAEPIEEIVEEAPAEEPAEEAVEEVEEAAEEAPAEEPVEAPAEEAPAEESAVEADEDVDRIMPMIIDPEKEDGTICKHESQPVDYTGELRTIVAVSETGHTYATQKVTGKQCPDCEYFFEYSLSEPVWDEEETPHNFTYYGSCEECDFYCEHPVDRLTPNGEPTTELDYKYKDEQTHTVYEVTMQGYTCSVCGQTTSVEVSRVEKGTEEHAIEEYYPNYCWKCSHSVGSSGGETKEHHYELSWSNSDYKNWTADGDKCVGKCSIVTQYWQCTDEGCYDSYEKEVVIDENATCVREHYYNSYTGLCEACGARNPVKGCKHPNAGPHYYYSNQTKVDEDLIIGEDYEPTGYGTHKITVRSKLEYYCPDCGAEFDRIGVSTVEEACTAGEANEAGEVHCRKCDGLLKVNSTCAHDWVEIQRGTTSSNSKYTDNGDGTHTRTYDVSERVYSACKLCGAIKSESVPKGQKTEKSKHSFDSYGIVCSYCDAINTCKHPKLSDWTDAAYTEVCKPVDDKTHEVVELDGKTRVCPDCGFRESYSIAGTAKVSYQQNHSWNSKGYCSDCGMANPCKHEGNHIQVPTRMNYDGVTQKGTYGTVVKMDDKNHTVKYARFVEERCADCGMALSAKFEKVVTESEPHTWVKNADGSTQCSVCGRKGASISMVSSLTLSVKETYTLKPKATKDKSFKYTVAPAGIVVVSSKGKITAKAEGQATITATGKSSGIQATCVVTVYPAPEELVLTKPEQIDYTTDDGTVTLSAAIKPEKAQQSVVWSSSNKSVAKVEDGVVTLVGQGSAKITATTVKKTTKGKKLSQSFNLNVTDMHMPATIAIEGGAKQYVDLGSKLALSYVLTPVKEGQTPESGVTWSIPKKQQKIATIDENGVVQAGSKEGSVTVTATTDKKCGTGKTLKQLSAKVQIVVADPDKPRELKINEGSAIALYEGMESLTLHATITPESAAKGGVTWSISKKQQKIATIDENGVLTPVAGKTGTVTVTAKSNIKKSNKKYATASIKVTVGANPKVPFSVALDKQGTVELKKGDTLTLSATIEPAAATEQTELTWTSSKTGIAKVENGVVTGVKKGTATITVKTGNGKKASVKVKVVN